MSDKHKTLDFENQAFLEVVEEDSLVIMARGLGIERMFLNLLKIYADPGNLILVIGTNAQEEEYFIEQLEEQKVTNLPKSITADTNSNERQIVYMQGGVLFVTSRILIVDLLCDRVPIELITGFLVYKAHRVIESAQEAFILRLYRQKNKTGFVKGFSESPDSFTAGFCHVERVMRNLFVRKIHLWPRFHTTVNSSLEESKPEVIELHIPMTPAMIAIQTALLDLISVCVKELKHCNQTLDTDELTVENAMSKAFDKVVKFQLDPVWNQLSRKSKQLVDDLRTLRNILVSLTQYDCVTFHNLLQSLRSNEKAFHEANWLFLDAAETMFLHGKQRVFGELDPKLLAKEKLDPDLVSDIMPTKPETFPKWTAVMEVMKEIEQDKADNSTRSTLILTADSHTSHLLKDLLTTSSEALLQRLYKKTAILRSGKKEEEVSEKCESTSKTEASNKLKSKQKWKNNQNKELAETDKKADKPGNESEDKITIENSVVGSSVVIQSYRESDHFSLVRTLQELKPRYVIMYDADVETVRRLEIFKAQHPKHSLRVYFLLYNGTAEEQRYLTLLRKEKEAFELLIKEKATMVIPEERDGKLDDNPDLLRDPRRANQTVNDLNTRAGGSSTSRKEQQIVLVDSREFRSDLPSLIHRRGIDIVPLTLEVGDYILTPEICVERKSVSDLIGSLNNGRLYNQALAMSRYYKRPMLLIEFDQNKPFTIQDRDFMSSNVSQHDVSSKLLLLTLHFPSLRILWCASPYATAELFEELKAGREQPDATQALSVAKTELETMGNGSCTDKYNSAPQDFLLKLPAVNTKNCYSLMNKARDLEQMTKMSADEIGEVIGNQSAAQVLYESIHKPLNKLRKPIVQKTFQNRKRKL